MIYFYGDPHFNHNNIIGLCNRPFKSVEEMNEILILNYVKIIKPNDEVYIVGDVAHKGDSWCAIKILKRLPGIKYLVKGNHDKKNLKDPKFVEMFASIEHRYEINYNKNMYIIDHYPLCSWNGMYRKSIMIHAHCHNKLNNDKALRFDCGVDNPICSFAPISIDIVETIMNKKKLLIKNISE